MQYPNFFDDIKTIVLKDDLSSYLGTFEDGIVEFSFLDIVKMAGHSCPTVAGAYLSTLHGLQNLYENEIPKRGEIKVEFSSLQVEGVAGVIGSVISNITGATTDNGFKGIGSNFNRCNLMFFGSNISSFVRFTRLDNSDFVDVYYDPSSIPLENQNSSKEEFGKIWQKRVKGIFENQEKVIKVVKGN